MRGLSLVVASGGHSSSRCAGLSLSRPLLLRSTGSRRAGSAAVAHGPSCSAARAILPDQGSNPCPLHWQADSQPLRHQGRPRAPFIEHMFHIHRPGENRVAPLTPELPNRTLAQGHGLQRQGRELHWVCLPPACAPSTRLLSPPGAG